MVSLSSAELEYWALAAITTKVVWLQSLLLELGIKLQQVPILWYDYLSAQSLASNVVFNQELNTSRLQLILWEKRLQKKKVEIRYVLSNKQTTDLFTKALSQPQFEFLCSKLLLSLPPCSLREDLKTDKQSSCATSAGSSKLCATLACISTTKSTKVS